MNKDVKDHTIVNYEKHRYSLIHKSNTETMETFYDIRKRIALVLSTKQLEQMKNDYGVQCFIFQEI
jgi:hypothetical protein